jgi:hypothetical protein
MSKGWTAELGPAHPTRARASGQSRSDGGLVTLSSAGGERPSLIPSAGWWIGPAASPTTAGHTAAGITSSARNTARCFSRAHDLQPCRAFPDQTAATVRLGGATFGGSHPAASAFLCHIGMWLSFDFWLRRACCATRRSPSIRCNPTPRGICPRGLPWAGTRGSRDA